MHESLQRLRQVCSDFSDCIEIFNHIFAHYQPMTILEVGMGAEKRWKGPEGCGQSYRALLILCAEYNAQKMISIDIDDCWDTVRKSQEWVRHEYGDIFERHCWDRIHSLDFDAKIYFPSGIDLLFLDSSHDADTDIQGAGGAGMTYREICHFAPYISTRGRIMLHDSFEYYQRRQAGNNVQGAAEKFLMENKNWYAIEHNTKTGLLELRRK